MPNATAAHFDDDFALREPAWKKAPTRRAAGKPSAAGKRKKSKSRFRFDVDMQKVARYAAVAMSVTVATGIMVNALVMQKSRHPAPLFGKSFALGEPAAVPLPPKAPRIVEGSKDGLKNNTTQGDAAVTPPALSMQSAPPENDSAPASNDAIGRLLQGGSIPADQSDSKSVLGAQRALIKLGFVVKPTGVLGPQTKKAIERFEKDHHLPVNGTLSRRLVKVLAAESGFKLDR